MITIIETEGTITIHPIAMEAWRALASAKVARRGRTGAVMR